MNPAALLTVLAATTAPPDLPFPYPVGPALSLEKLEKEADMIAKVVVISSAPVADEWFTKASGFAARETKMMVVTYLKGATRSSEIAFRHYGAADRQQAFHYMPQHYALEKGKPYILFAKKTGRKGTYRQLWKHHRTKVDQGLLRAAGHKLHKKKTVKQVFWAELTELLAAKKTADVRYAITQLDEMSGGSYYELHDFARQDVLAAVAPFLKHPAPKLALQAATVLGSRNPMMDPGFVPFWLGTIGNGASFPGLSRWSTKKKFLAGELLAPRLIEIIDGGAPVALRAKAIRAMGCSRHPAVPAAARRWLTDPAPEVRAAAVVLSSDYPRHLTTTPAKEPDRIDLRTFTADPSPLVRTAAAHCIGFGRIASGVPLLVKMLADEDPKVVVAATQSLLSFPDPAVAAHLRAHVAHADMGVLFVNALARSEPEPHLANLCDIVEKGREPTHWWGGSMPWGISWDILIRYVQAQQKADLSKPKFARIFAALESPLRGTRARYFGSSQPRDLYALYVRRGLQKRAREFRALCEKKIRYNIGAYFDKVDRNPGGYRR